MGFSFFELLYIELISILTDVKERELLPHKTQKQVYFLRIINENFNKFVGSDIE